MYDCQFLTPSMPLNTPYDCTGVMGQDECAAVAVYDRNMTMPAPASLLAKEGAGRPFGLGLSKYWVGGAS